MSPAAAIVAIYLMATLPILAFRPGWALAAHVLALGALWWSRLPPAAGRNLAGDWLPLLLVPLLYAQLPFMMSGGYHDAMVQHWELAVFGHHPSATLAARWPWPAVSEGLHLGYLSYYGIIYLPPLVLWLRRRDQAFQLATASVMATFVVCFAVFIAWPVQGPRYLWTPDAPDGPVRQLVLALLQGGSSRGAAFPSSHAAVAMAQVVAMATVSRPAAAALALCTAALCVGAVYGGFHYAVDMMAGAALGATIALIVRHWLRHRYVPSTSASASTV
jgi:membrane-associated phospholipid phosphatase